MTELDKQLLDSYDALWNNCWKLIYDDFHAQTDSKFIEPQIDSELLNVVQISIDHRNITQEIHDYKP